MSKTFDKAGGIIGRSHEADLVIPDPDQYVSRKQAMISYHEGAYYITDMGSRNRMLVNDRPVSQSTEIRLADGDVLTMADYTLEISLSQDSSEEELLTALPSTGHIDQGDAPVVPLPPPDDFEPFWEMPKRAHESIPQKSVEDHVPALMGSMPTVNPIPENYDFWRGSTLPPSVEDENTVRTEGLGSDILTPIPATAAAAAGTALAEGIRALLRGAGAAELQIPLTAQLAFMETVGALLRAFVQGAVEALLGRARVRDGMRAASRTMLKSRDNNPLKFAPPDEALRHLLAPHGSAYLPPVNAVEEAFSDLKDHELAMVSGIRAALAQLLSRYSPAEIEKSLQQHSGLKAVLSARRKARLWDLFTELHEEIMREAEDNFERLFGEAFVRAYEKQLASLRAGRRKNGAGRM